MSRWGFIKNVALGATAAAAGPLLLSGCGDSTTFSPPTLKPDAAPPADSSITKSTDTYIHPKPDIDTITPLEARIKAVLGQDARFKLYNYQTKQKYTSPEKFVEDLEDDYGIDGAQKMVTSLEKAATDLKTIESELMNTYKVGKFFKEIGFEVSHLPLAGGGHANGDKLRITLFPPVNNSYNKHTKTVVAHEYGHFLYFHGTDGKVVYSNQNGFRLSRA